jgi:hypothetical protein
MVKKMETQIFGLLADTVSLYGQKIIKRIATNQENADGCAGRKLATAKKMRKILVFSLPCVFFVFQSANTMIEEKEEPISIKLVRTLLEFGPQKSKNDPDISIKRKSASTSKKDYQDFFNNLFVSKIKESKSDDVKNEGPRLILQSQQSIDFLQKVRPDYFHILSSTIEDARSYIFDEHLSDTQRDTLEKKIQNTINYDLSRFVLLFLSERILPHKNDREFFRTNLWRPVLQIINTDIIENHNKEIRNQNDEKLEKIKNLENEINLQEQVIKDLLQTKYYKKSQEIINLRKKLEHNKQTLKTIQDSLQKEIPLLAEDSVQYLINYKQLRKDNEESKKQQPEQARRTQTVTAQGRNYELRTAIALITFYGGLGFFSALLWYLLRSRRTQ